MRLIADCGSSGTEQSMTTWCKKTPSTYHDQLGTITLPLHFILQHVSIQPTPHYTKRDGRLNRSNLVVCPLENRVPPMSMLHWYQSSSQLTTADRITIWPPQTSCNTCADVVWMLFWTCETSASSMSSSRSKSRWWYTFFSSQVLHFCCILCVLSGCETTARWHCITVCTFTFSLP